MNIYFMTKLEQFRQYKAKDHYFDQWLWEQKALQDEFYENYLNLIMFWDEMSEDLRMQYLKDLNTLADYMIANEIRVSPVTLEFIKKLIDDPDLISPLYKNTLSKLYASLNEKA